jgi:hypothetical protein
VRSSSPWGTFYRLREGRRSVGEVSFNLISFDIESGRGVDEAPI